MRHAIWPPSWVMIAIVMLFAPAPLDAHDGPHGPEVLTRVLSTERKNNQLAVTIEMTGLGGPIVLTRISAPGATSPAIAPVYVNFAEDALVSTQLTFATAIPTTFTLTLTFGPLGETTLEVFP
ncbi:MAG: hypothetical protein ABJ263_12450 [Tateyamaria sp.]